MWIRFKDLLSGEEKMENKIQTVVTKNIEIGKGIPKICIPVQGKTKKEVFDEMTEIRQFPCDLIEWRGDDLETVDTDLEEVLKRLKTIESEKPILFTYRTQKEGGNGKDDLDVYRNLNMRVIESGMVDLLDVEYSKEEMLVNEIIEFAHSSGIKVILSSHDFQNTPSIEEMLQKMCRMQETGADIVKLAVMPDSKEDVLALMQATEKMNRLYATVPLITMSMSETGAVSRFCGGKFGSSVTFAAGTNPSAPGQPEADELQKVLSIIYKSM